MHYLPVNCIGDVWRKMSNLQLQKKNKVESNRKQAMISTNSSLDEELCTSEWHDSFNTQINK